MPQHLAKTEIAARRRLIGAERDNVKVVGETSDFANAIAGAQQEVLTLLVDAAEDPHDVADVGPYAEIPNGTDVDGHPHGGDSLSRTVRWVGTNCRNASATSMLFGSINRFRGHYAFCARHCCDPAVDHAVLG